MIIDQNQQAIEATATEIDRPPRYERSHFTVYLIGIVAAIAFTTGATITLCGFRDECKPEAKYIGPILIGTGGLLTLIDAIAIAILRRR